MSGDEPEVPVAGMAGPTPTDAGIAYDVPTGPKAGPAAGPKAGPVAGPMAGAGASVAADPTAGAVAAPSRPQRSILVAEDNDAHRMVLRRVMGTIEAPFDIRISFVESGAALLAALRGMERSARPDILLLDLHMPGISGIETLQRLHQDAELRAIPVVILSSSDSSHHVEQAYGAGANAYLVKRGDYTALREQMKRFTAFWLDTALTPGSGSR